MHPETVAIHAGRAPRVAGEPLNPPLVPASNFFDGVYAREQVVDTTDTDATLAACADADLLYVETPSNPLVEIAELDPLCAAPCAVAVDGTFATPLLQRALALGADFAIQSATKFIAGHSDLLLGVVTTRDAAPLREVRAQLGATPGALEAYLALRGLRTLPVRLRTAQRSAQLLAERLSARHTVHYPGLPGDPGHARATRLMDGYGAMLSFEHDDADGVCARVRVITHAKSLGGVESLIERRAPGLVRLSVGCEHVEDLWDDLEQAL